MQMFPLSATAKCELKRQQFRVYALSKFFTRYRKQLRKILNDNAKDFLRSVALQRALSPLMDIDVTGMSVVEPAVGGTWYPFRVEHALSGSLRGNLGWDTFSGVVTPQLLDSSSLVFLRNEEGETLRVIVPSSTTARQMLARVLEEWTDWAGGYTDSWRNRGGTHTGNVIHNFALKQNLANALEHPHIIDSIDASCEALAQERPRIRIFGKQIREGVVLASALQVNDNQCIFVPTKFFDVLTEQVYRLMPNNHAPKLITA